jgi:hypothetical protein
VVRVLAGPPTFSARFPGTIPACRGHPLFSIPPALANLEQDEACVIHDSGFGAGMRLKLLAAIAAQFIEKSGTTGN